MDKLIHTDAADRHRYNYKSVRYAHDGKKFPNRVIYGSESYPRATFQTWKDTLANPNVIGDFVWTAWDYIGEVGVGRWEESEAPRPSDPKWPWLLASCSDIDLIGQKRPQSYYRDAVWNDDHSPHLFCLPPALTGKNITRLSWGWLPVERNYSFPGQEGKPLEVHIYANADNVELFQNGNSLGSKPCGEGEEYQAVFTINYQPGSLTAVSYRDGQECGRDEIITAGATERLHLLADRSVIRADGRDLCFVTIKAVDANGLPVYNESGKVTVKVMGARLQGLGNADPMTDALYPFTTDTCSLYHGMALAVIRSEEGSKGCMIEVTLEGREPVSLAIGFSPCESADTDLVSEAKPGAIDKTLGELLENPAARQVLENNYAQILQNPMLDSMKGMSLKKLLSMGGMEIPQAFCDALNKAFEEE